MSDGAHDDIRALLGAYALNAVDDVERRAVERHLEGCAECAAEVAEHLDTAAMLAADPAGPPARVWERITAHVEGAPDAVPPPRVMRLRRGARRPRPRLLVAAAAATVLVGVGVGVASLSGGGAGTELALRTPAGERSAVITLDDDGDGRLVDDDLPRLPSTQTYQLWALRGDTAVSAGVLGRDPNEAAFTLVGPVDGFALTIEEAGGAIAPSAEPIAAAYFG